MFKKCTILFLFLITAAVSAQKISIKFTDLLTIGGKETDKIEYQFRRPAKIEADSKGIIYIQDFKQTSFGNGALIKQFSPDGKFLADIGRQGEGPGDFKWVADFAVTPDDKVLIYDNSLLRISVYDNVKKKFEIIGKALPPMTNPRLFVLNNEKILVLAPSYFLETNPNLLYIKSYDWKTNYYDFGHPSIFIDSSDPLFKEKVESAHKELSIAVIDENNIVAAPQFYSGELTLLTNTGGEWKAKRFEGVKPKYRSFEKIKNEEFSTLKFREHPHASSGSSSRVNYAYVAHAMSEKLFIYKNKYILHYYSVCRHPSAVDYCIDMFDLQGKFLGSNNFLTSGPNGQVEGRAVYLYSKDKNDNFYVVEMINGIPSVKKVKLDIEIK